MNHAVLVRGTLRRWDLVGWIVMGFFAAGAGILFWLHRDVAVGATLMVAGAVAVPVSAVALRLRVRRRQWARVTEKGFILTGQSFEREFSDDEIVSMALSYKKNYADGNLKSVTRRLLVWIVSAAELPEQVTLETTFAAEWPDPLGALIVRIGDHLCKLARQDLAAGRTVEGERWTWHGGQLTIREQNAERACHVGEVAAIGRVDRKLRVWRQGEAAAWAEFPEESANLYVIERLLAEELARRPAQEGPPADGSLGRVIFERSPSRTRARVTLAGGIMFLVSALGCGIPVALAAEAVQAGVLLTALFLLLAAGCAVEYVRLRRTVFRCHLHGVFQSGLFGERSMRYVDVEAFAYKAVRQLIHGAYVNTYYTLTFEPARDRGLARIRYSFDMPHGDDEVDRLRDEVSGMIAGRMLRQLEKAEPVPWLSKVRFLPEGLEYTTRWRRQVVIAPYASLADGQIKQGVFHIRVKSTKRPVMRVEMSQRNFFPGLLALQCLMRKARAEQ